MEQGDASRPVRRAERFEKLRDRPLAEKRAAVNAAVNKDIAFVWDQWNYGIEERFATPAETLREGRGDCEDYAVMKYFLLRHLDVPADNLLLAVVDIPDGKHMVLLAGEALRLCQAGNRGMFMGTHPNGILVLDNKNRDKPPPALESAPYRDAYFLMNEKKALKKDGDNVWRMERNINQSRCLDSSRSERLRHSHRHDDQKGDRLSFQKR